MAGIPFFVRPLPFAVTGFTSQLAANPVSHLAEFQYAGMTWKTVSITAGSAQIIVDLGVAGADVDFVGLLGTNAQAGTIVQFEMDNNDATLGAGTAFYRSGTQTLITPAVTGRSTYHWHWELPNVVNRRYASIIISGHTGAFESVFLVMGKKVSAARYYEPEWESGPEDFSTISFSRNGVPEIASGVSFRSKAFTLGWLTEAEFEKKFQPLLQSLGRTNPVFLSFDPEATTYRQARTYFGTMRDTSRVRKVRFNQMEKKFEILSKI
jgi:hypothetical protein